MNKWDFRTELDFTVAIDFTKSNLPLEDDSSLHRVRMMWFWLFLNANIQVEIDGSANQYEIAIESIAEVCLSMKLNFFKFA